MASPHNDSPDGPRELRRLGFELAASAPGPESPDTAPISSLEPPERESLDAAPAPSAEPPGRTAARRSEPRATRSEERLVEGRVLSDDGLPAGGLVVRLYQHNVGGAQTQLGEVKTDPQGAYALPYTLSGTANIEMRAVDAQGAQVVLSNPRFGAGQREELNLVAPTAAVPRAPEVTQLQTDLVKQVADAGLLGRVDADPESNDVLALQAATGWDARVVSLALVAEKRTSETGLGADLLYGAFRAGLPTDADRFARVGSEPFGQALVAAREAGVIALDDAQLAAAKEGYAAFERVTRRGSAAPGTVSTFGELLSRSGLTDDEQSAFEDVYNAHRGSGEALWNAVRKQVPGLSEAKVAGLRLQGKLASLTLNNAPLVESLHREVSSPAGLGELVSEGLHHAERWKERLTDLAATTEGGIEGLVPATYDGSPEVRLDAYADELARKVRLSFPTKTVAQEVADDELVLGPDHERVKGHVMRVMQNAEANGAPIELGKTPLGMKLREGNGLFDGVPDADRPATDKALKQLHRLYQITPSDHALGVLLSLGIGSAAEVVAISKTKFVALYATLFRPGEAELVYSRSVQVSHVVFNSFIHARQVLSPPGAAVLSPSPAVQTASQERIRRHFPTLETLFGSLDYCECEHCRSVLSPAAYLVDLLQFLDPGDLEWGDVRSAWKTANGSDYPYRRPYEVLAKRRPDLPSIPLTCANTNTVLPYIDVVNEVLEYYVAHGKLDALAVRDSSDVPTEDLLAEPHFITEGAYRELATEVYPPALPFDLWSETSRRFLEHFDTSHAALLEAFRRSDTLLSTSTDPQSFGHAAVFLEQLELSPAEAVPFTDADLLKNRWWELFGYPSGAGSPEATALAELSSAKTLARRLGVSYRELVQLVRSSFVNPRLDALVALEKIGVEVGQVVRLKGQASTTALSAEEQAALKAKLAAAKTRYGFDAEAWIDARWDAGDFNNVVLLADTKGGCDFAATVLRFGDGRAIDKATLVRINLMVRLRCKLGWGLDELDQALRVLVPASRRPLSTLESIAESATSLLIYLAHLSSLDARLAIGKHSRQRLLTCWGRIATRGEEPLYAQLFLTPSVLNDDAIFDHPLGEYLSQPKLLLHDHLPAVQGALGLSATDVELIVEASGGAIETLSLSLDTVSNLLRHAVLARGLKLTVAELLMWKRLSGIDPFDPLTADPLVTLEQDRPFTGTIRFVDFVEAVRATGLTVADAAFVMRHEFDPVGPHRDRPDAVAALLRDLAGGLERIASDHALPADPATFSDDLLRQKLALLGTPEAVDTFFGMWKRSGGDGATPIAFDAVKADAFLSNAFPGVFAPGAASLFDPATPDSDRRERIAKVVLPLLAERESSRLIKHTLATQLDADDTLVESLLTDVDLLADPNVATGAVRLIESYLQAGTRGVTLTYFSSNDASGQPLQSAKVIAEPSISDIPGQAKSARVEGYIEVPENGIFRFSAAANAAGAEVILRVGASAEPVLLGQLATTGATLDGRAELKAGVLVPFTLEVHQPGSSFAVSVEGPSLALGSLGRLVLRPRTGYLRLERAHRLLSKVLVLAIGLSLNEREVRYVAAHSGDFAGFAWGALPMARPAAPPPAAAGGRQLLALVEYVLCRQTLNLGGNEMVDLVNGMARTVPATPDPKALEPKLLEDACAALGRALRRPPSSVGRLIGHFGFEVSSTPAGAGVRLSHKALMTPGSLLRLLRALAIVAKIGVSAEALVGDPAGGGAALRPAWAQPIPRPATGPDPGPRIAREIREGVRALYDAETWRRVVQPISDRLRRRKRDALVARIMHTGDFQSLEELFEHFLLDPGMEPVVYTSRIQLAIASVQTFIQRCFLNLEAEPALGGDPTLAVPPSALDDEHWQWMSRYRIWEANRRIFLFPENLLEPEFRDDKSYLFEALERALLEGDVSEDLVEDAFLTYLKGLDEIARLEVVSCSADEAHGTLHVLARTYGLPRKFFYRKNVWGSWHPWEPVSADIQGDHVIPVVWRRRLHLFWVTFMRKGAPSAPEEESLTELATRSPSTMVAHGLEAQLHWVERVNGKWLGRGSAPYIDLRLSADTAIDLSKVTIHATTDAPDGGPVLIHLSGGIGKALRLAGKNALPTLTTAQPPAPLAFTTTSTGPTFHRSAGALEVKDFGSRQVAQYGTDVQLTVQDVTVLGKDDGGGAFELVPVAHRVLSTAASRDERRIPLYRLYHPKVNDHFYTTSEAERDSARTLGYAYESVACDVLPADDPEGVPLFRLYHFQNYDHFYTTSTSERDAAKSVHGYVDEGVACNVPVAKKLEVKLGAANLVPLYQTLGRNDHFYTTSLAEKNNAVSNLGHVDQGFACSVFAPQLTAEQLIRLTSPVFYRDSQNVFFVDPSVDETTFDRWEEWAIPAPVVAEGPIKVATIVPAIANWSKSKEVAVLISPEATVALVPKGELPPSRDFAVDGAGLPFTDTARPRELV